MHACMVRTTKNFIIRTQKFPDVVETVLPIRMIYSRLHMHNATFNSLQNVTHLIHCNC